MPNPTTARPPREARPFAAPTGSATVVSVAIGLLTIALAILAASRDFVGAAVALVLALLVALLSVLGSTRLGILLLAGAFLTAPAYKGLAPMGATVTPTDGLLVLGFGLLLPEIIRGRLRLPLVYVTGASMVLVFGSIASLRIDRWLESFLTLIFWLIVMIGYPVAVSLWGPSAKAIRGLAWTYVAGHFISWFVGIAIGRITDGRHYGLTNHPNYFAEAAIMVVALLFYLFYEYKHWMMRLFIVGLVGLAGISILLSGSRGATIVVAVLVMMIPIVERSAVTGFLWAALGAAALAGLPFVLQLTGNTAAVDRLLGGGSAAGSDSERTRGLNSGLDRFTNSPFFGDGLIDLFHIHNNVLQVMAGIGVFGLFGFLMILFAMARPLFSNLAHRRLSYAVWGYLGWSLLIPSLYDRTLWIPMCLVAVCWVARPDSSKPTTNSPPTTPQTATSATAMARN